MTGRPGDGDRRHPASRPPDILVMGSASRDLAGDDARGWRLGGGVAYAALTCARLGVRVGAVIGLDPPAFGADELELLRAAGVELVRVALPHGPVFRNMESPGGRVQACLDPGTPLPLAALPAAWRAAPAWILAPVAGELDDSWAAPIPAAAFVALGWQGLLRTLVAGATVARRAPAASRLVERAGLVSVSRHDVRPGMRTEELAGFLRPGAWLVVTDGAAGGLAAEVTATGLGRIARYAAMAPGGELDPTGAGDTFLAALVARLSGPAGRDSRVGPVRVGQTLPAGDVPDVGFAAAAASFTVEGPGLTAVPHLGAVLGRLASAAPVGGSAAARRRSRGAVSQSDADPDPPSSSM